MDHFEVFDLPRCLVIDEADLQRRFYELSRRHHPDFHQGDSPADQSRNLAASALINAAYRALRDPIRRVDYLVGLEIGGKPDGADLKSKTPPALLAEMFEIQEALQEAESGGLDDAARAALGEQRARLEGRCRDEEARLRGPLAAAWDGAQAAQRPRALAACAESLATRAYLRTVIDDLARALDGEQEPHVAHHRH